MSSGRWTYETVLEAIEPVMMGHGLLQTELRKLINPNSYRDRVLYVQFYEEIEDEKREKVDSILLKAGWSRYQIEQESALRVDRMLKAL